MAETKKKYEAETPLPVRLKPAPRSPGKPPRRDDEHPSVSPAKGGEAERKELILRIINYLESM